MSMSGVEDVSTANRSGSESWTMDEFVLVIVSAGLSTGVGINGWRDGLADCVREFCRAVGARCWPRVRVFAADDLASPNLPIVFTDGIGCELRWPVCRCASPLDLAPNDGSRSGRNRLTEIVGGAGGWNPPGRRQLELCDWQSSVSLRRSISNCRTSALSLMWVASSSLASDSRF